MIRQVFPWVAVEGLEVSSEASIFAQEQFKLDPAVRITCGDMLHESEVWDPHEVDVVVSCYSLAYVAPEDLSDLLEAVVRSAAKAVVLVEPMYGPPGRMPVQYTAEWRHTYTDLLEPLLRADGRPARMTGEKLDTPVESCDGIVTVHFQ
jgi:hypothetical protein